MRSLLVVLLLMVLLLVVLLMVVVLWREIRGQEQKWMRMNDCTTEKIGSAPSHNKKIFINLTSSSGSYA